MFLSSALAGDRVTSVCRAFAVTHSLEMVLNTWAACTDQMRVLCHLTEGLEHLRDSVPRESWPSAPGTRRKRGVSPA